VGCAPPLSPTPALSPKPALSPTPALSPKSAFSPIRAFSPTPALSPARALRFHSGCTKSAVGSSGKCVVHGGGHRCDFDGCDKSALAPTTKCKAHGGGRRCAYLGCPKSARDTVGSSSHCKAHGGESAFLPRPVRRLRALCTSLSFFPPLSAYSLNPRSDYHSSDLYLSARPPRRQAVRRAELPQGCRGRHGQVRGARRREALRRGRLREACAGGIGLLPGPWRRPALRLAGLREECRRAPETQRQPR